MITEYRARDNVVRSARRSIFGAVLTQQCFSGSGCTGSAVVAPGPSASDCCVGTDDGQSYGSSGDCAVPQCIGICGFQLCMQMHYFHSLPPIVICLQSHEQSLQVCMSINSWINMQFMVLRKCLTLHVRVMHCNISISVPISRGRDKQ